MEVLEQLQAYLEHMGQMGYSGLELEESPFTYQPPAPQPKMRPAGRPTPQKVPGGTPPPKQRPTPVQAEAPAKPKAETPSLISIMETVNMLGSEPDTRTKAAEVAGDSPTDVLRNLYSAFQRCQSCALGTTRNRFVFGEGPADAKLMFVGEYPTRIDDTSGRPFMDQSGQLLSKIIKAMGFSRGDVFITNVVKCAPPGRTPLPDELDACAPVLERQIEAVNPKVIVALGPTALRFFKGEGMSLMRMSGQVFQWKSFQVVATYHPSYILRNPRAKRDVWDALQKILPLLKEAN